MPKRFNGVVNLDVRDSVPDWTPFREQPAPANAPNVLIVLYDDTGLAAWSLYGDGSVCRGHGSNGDLDAALLGSGL